MTQAGWLMLSWHFLSTDIIEPVARHGAATGLSQG